MEISNRYLIIIQASALTHKAFVVETLINYETVELGNGKKSYRETSGCDVVLSDRSCVFFHETIFREKSYFSKRQARAHLNHCSLCHYL